MTPPPAPWPSTVGVVGLGLMGGSLARALQDLPHPPSVLGISPDKEDLVGAEAAGVLDDAAGPQDSLPDTLDLLVYAAPLGATLSLMERHAGELGPETLVTDVVSLKLPLLDAATAAGLGPRFVGSHPMVGGTGTGFGHSTPDLFQGAHVWVTPGQAAEGRIQDVEGLWRRLGARPERVDGARHDALMAWVSHLPQLVGNALALALEGQGIRPHSLGRGGREMTRLAGSGPEMWRDILQRAPKELGPALEALEGELKGIRKLLEEDDLEGVEKIMKKTRQWRGVE